ncbi:MAG: cellulase family glycosylhydrolase [Polyangiaceae bacterium]|nr:cellulase family glycosylhydrolase [Polyangiaceae bacterium]
MKPSVRSRLRYAAAVAFVAVAIGCSSQGATETPPASASATAKQRAGDRFYVEGRFLRDPCGEKLVLRGVNEMFVWNHDRTGAALVEQIDRSGANAVRVVWTTKDGTVAEMDKAIENVAARGMLPIIELHDATGDIDKLELVMSHWLSPEVLAVLKKHEKHLVLNVGNEIGDASVPRERFQDVYVSAIRRLRDAGVRAPIMIDASTWGQDLERLVDVGPALVKSDPQGDVLLSVHAWWTDGSRSAIAHRLTAAVESGLPIVVGEFGPHAVFECEKHPFDLDGFLEITDKLEIGFVAWSWGGVNNRDCAGSFDMTEGGDITKLRPWGRLVVEQSPHGIARTSVRSRFLSEGRCHER